MEGEIGRLSFKKKKIGRDSLFQQKWNWQKPSKSIFKQY